MKAIPIGSAITFATDDLAFCVWAVLLSFTAQRLIAKLNILPRRATAPSVFRKKRVRSLFTGNGDLVDCTPRRAQHFPRNWFHVQRRDFRLLVQKQDGAWDEANVNAVVTKDFEQLPFLFRTFHFYVVRVHFRCASLSSIGCGLLNLEDAFGAPLFRVCYTSSAATLDWSSLDAYRYVVCGLCASCLKGGGEDVFVYISAVRALASGVLNEGQAIEFELVSNRGKTSRENLRVRR